jgi:hypothetical protein
MWMGKSGEKMLHFGIFFNMMRFRWPAVSFLCINLIWFGKAETEKGLIGLCEYPVPVLALDVPMRFKLLQFWGTSTDLKCQTKPVT